jgi:hypothetical protein
MVKTRMTKAATLAATLAAAVKGKEKPRRKRLLNSFLYNVISYRNYKPVPHLFVTRRLPALYSFTL